MSRGVNIISTRLWIAYVMIALMVAAAVAAVVYLRHNTHHRKIERRRAREKRHLEDSTE